MKDLKNTVLCLLMLLFLFSLSGCGIDMSKIKGEWIIDTVDGRSPLKYYERKGKPVFYCLKITETKIKLGKYDEKGRDVEYTDYYINVNGDTIEGYENKNDKEPEIVFEFVEDTLIQYLDDTIELIYEKTDDDPEEELEKLYKKGENARKSNDIENYNALVCALNTASTSEEVIREIKNDPVTVHFTSAGVSGMSFKLLESCERTLPELADLSSYRVTSSEWADADFTISVYFSSGDGICVTRTCAPSKDF